MSFEDRLRLLDIELAPKQDSKPSVANCVEVNGLVFVSGHGPEDDKGQLLYRGRVGAELTAEEGYAAARATGIQLLRSVRAYLGSLDRVQQIVKVFGLVNSADDFVEQPKVINGCSDLFVEVFGQAGRHARSAMGTSVLPGNQPVEIEMVLAVTPAERELP